MIKNLKTKVLLMKMMKNYNSIILIKVKQIIF